VGLRALAHEIQALALHPSSSFFVSTRSRFAKTLCRLR
jgi:hypothetical protein